MATGGKLNELTSADAVRAAIAEFREIGRAAFLEAYGFHRSLRFYLVSDGLAYDSKPIAAAAYGHQHGRKNALHFDDFSGGQPVVTALGKMGFRVVDWTSGELTVDAIYTREQLRELFKIEDATINTGVFRVKNRSSIWLFVTKEKTSDRTQYEDRFEGDLLFWQGQMTGRTDGAIIAHEAMGDELLVFYRDSRSSYPGAGFRFEGQFRYLSHTGGSPTNFVLQRSSARDDLELPRIVFDPGLIEDARKSVWAQVKSRQGQPEFRRTLMKAYGGRCAITGCRTEAVLEAAHIHPYQGAETNVVVNGLLLRADIHTLFDLGMITIAPDYKIEISRDLGTTEYAALAGQALRTPTVSGDRPSGNALAWHRAQKQKIGE